MPYISGKGLLRFNSEDDPQHWPLRPQVNMRAVQPKVHAVVLETLVQVVGEVDICQGRGTMTVGTLINVNNCCIPPLNVLWIFKINVL